MVACFRYINGNGQAKITALLQPVPQCIFDGARQVEETLDSILRDLVGVLRFH